MPATLQFVVRYALKLGEIFVFALMIACTVFVVACIIRGDISIKIVRSKDEKENK